ncbi:MAG: outer membrane protein assembly factor BamA [Treponema sp.]|nr:outer membrane protein assembly factor BamA [Treponema sp.]
MKFRVFALLLFLPAVFAFSQDTDNADDWFQGKPIRDIVFSGLKNISPSELDGLMQPFKGRAFNDSIFWEITGRLYALEYFDSIESSTHRANQAGTEVVIRFTVSERPVIGRISFVGNSGIRRHELMDVIISKVSDVYNLAKVRIDTEAIINKYLEKGYPNATVTTTEIQSSDTSISLIFNIDEGDKITISRIEFQGNNRFTNNALRGQLSLKAKSLLNDGAFQEAKLLADREAITRYYHDRGYIDMFIRDVIQTAESDDKGTNMVLVFMIEEGNEFKFDGITFEGNVIFKTEQLQKLVYSKVGDIVNMTRLEMDMQRVADLYFENGYIFNLITRTQNKDDHNLTLSYAVHIVERSRAYIENVIIIGNEKTKTNVILREIPLEPGDVFSKTKVMEAMRNLFNLQYFSMIIPDTLPGSTENMMDLVFTFEEQATTDIQFGLTFSGSADPDSFPISGLFKWHDRNFFGTGNELGAELNSSIVDSTSFSLNYLHRWVFGLPLSLGIDFTFNHTIRLALMNNQSPLFFGNEDYAFPDGFKSYEEFRARNYTPTRDFLMDYRNFYLSVGFSTGYRWSTFMGILGISGGVRFGWEMNEYDADLYRPFDPVLRAGNNSWMPRNSFWLTFTLDQRDIFYDPSRGFYLYDRIAFFGFLDSEREHFMRNDLKVQYYHTLFNFQITDKWSFKCVLAMHAGLSMIFNQPFRGDPLQPDISRQNMLSIDGMFIGRGWNEFNDKGYVLFESWVELRFPIVYGILALDLFFDSAAKEEKAGSYFGRNIEGRPNFTIERFRFSFGGGLRFTIPQFPIRLSLAKGFTIEDGNIVWKTGSIFNSANTPGKGLDLVVSFAISY